MTEWGAHPTNNRTTSFSLEAQDEDYDTYLFWPSLSNGQASSKMSFVETHHGPVSSPFDRVEYRPGWEAAPSSPLSLTPPSDFRFSLPGEYQALNNGVPKVRGNEVQEKDSLPRYSSLRRMGLLLTRVARHVDRAMQSVGIVLRKTKTRGRAVKRTHTFASAER
ncbi:hypothetical protein BC827DRAFT_1167006 [Russula dissimulans]|nr:hypothetical protein BC827DRAFT_1167006 [Russula dissimulans]